MLSTKFIEDAAPRVYKLEKRFEDAIEKLEIALSNKIMGKEV